MFEGVGSRECIFTLYIMAGLFGLGIILIPETIKLKFTWPVEEPVAFGIIGSVYLAFGLLSVLGLRSPLKFVPVLLLQVDMVHRCRFTSLGHCPFPELRCTYCDNLCNLYSWRPDRNTVLICFRKRYKSLVKLLLGCARVLTELIMARFSLQRDCPR